MRRVNAKNQNAKPTDQSKNGHPSANQEIEQHNRSGGTQSNTPPNQSHNSSKQLHPDDNGEICEMCKAVRGGSWIVQCDGCNGWYHFNCVKFNEDEVSDEEPWFCSKCQEISRKVMNEIAATNQQEHIVNSNAEQSESSRVRQRQTDVGIESLVRSFMRWNSTQTENSDTYQRRFTTRPKENTESQRHLSQRNESQQSELLSQRVVTTVAQVHSNPSDSDMVAELIPAMNIQQEQVNATHPSETDNMRSAAGQSYPGRAVQVQSSRGTLDSDTLSFKSVSSRKTSASQKARIEHRLAAELVLQAKLDEERMALKESRERRFLEEMFKAMNDEENSSDGGSEKADRPKSSGQQIPQEKDTPTVLGWIEDQRKRKTLAAQVTPDISIEVTKGEIENIIENRGRTENGTNLGAGRIESESATMIGSGSKRVQQTEIGQRFECQNAQGPITLNLRSNSTLIDCHQPVHGQKETVYRPEVQRAGAAPLSSTDGRQLGAIVTREDGAKFNPSITWSHAPTQQNTGDQNHQKQIHQKMSPTITPSNQQNYVNPTIVSSVPHMVPQNQQNYVNPTIVSSVPHMVPQNQQNYVNPTIVSSVPHMVSLNQQNAQSQNPQRSQTCGSNPTIQFGQTSTSSNNVYGPQSYPHSSSYQFDDQTRELTANQIASRHVLKDPLPSFSGNPGEWPEFIQRYNSTTTACGINNVENLERLRKCLTGKAKTLVRAQLSIPECVPSIIATLEDKYGRKEVVVRAILAELRAEPQIKADKLEDLSNFGYKVQNAVCTIQRQQMEFYLHDPGLLQELVDKLPNQTKIDWAKHSRNVPVVTVVTLCDWLMELSRAINRITMPDLPAYSDTDHKKDQKEKFKGGTYVSCHGNNNKRTTVNGDHEADQSSKCEYCAKGCKTLAECSKFKAISVDGKWKFLYTHKRICRGCLRVHGKGKCSRVKECGENGCSFKHHPILHDKERMLSKAKANQTNSQQSNPSSNKSNTEHERSPETQKDSSCNAHRGGQSVLYKIVPVKLTNNNKAVYTLAYLDEGSGLTLLDRKLAEELELRGTPQKLCLKWTSGTLRHENDSMRVVLRISGKGENQHSYQIRDVRTVNSLDLPRQKINKEELVKTYPYLQKIPFEDFDAEPRILIGLDNIKLGVSREYVEGKWTEPIASKTLLGWVIHGQNGLVPDGENQLMQHHIVNVHQCQCETDKDSAFHRQIEEFFSLENFGIRALTRPTESIEDQRASKIMERSTVRTNGRFETSLLWRYDDVKLPNNFSMAMKRLECQERRIQSNPSLMENINNQIRNFVAKGYARKLSTDEINVDDPRIWYLPVFHYLDPKKPEKVRLVWDAAAKYKGMSLNSMLMTGPDSLVALIDILRRYREKRIAVGGDLEEMYHQVRVKQRDQNSQRFLWRNGKIDAKPDIYVMEVLTFGTNCSPSLAQHVKDRNATEFEDEYPKAAKAIKVNHYVDDWLDSTHTVEEAIQLAKDVKYVHQQGGFNLRKFVSNSKEVLNALGDEKTQQTINLDVDATLGTQKILGMWWNAQTDCFTYSLKYTKVNEEVLLGLRAPTKREVLKTLMSIYDPLGLIAFFLVYLKMLIQEIWKARIAWDEQIPDELNEKWQRWIRFLPQVENIKIPRLYSEKISPGTPKSIELHTFADASIHAYCAACFLRIEDEDGVDVVLVGAKTKVAPIKPLLTIPRLELLAAVLGTRLAKSIEQGLTIKIDKRFYWSDSRDVSCWIKSTTRKYRQFVAYRVGEILEETKESEWRWVPGELNVADEGTKWKKNPNLDSSCRWFRGPSFLYGEKSSWPPDLPMGETTEEEIHVHLAIQKTNPPSLLEPKGFSKWSTLVNVQALVNRFIQKLKAKIKGRTIGGPLATNELIDAENKLYKLAQFDCFYSEIELLKNPTEKFGPRSYVPKTSPIYKLSPYVGDDGLLRVRGRIDNIRGVKSDTKRPIILPKDHKITELVVNNYHRMYLHGNNETVINELRQKFVIPKIRVMLKRIVSQCQLCKNNKAKPVMPEMGDLPVSRLSPGLRPFTYTGVDYFGPMNVVVKKGTEKRWGVLFTCLTTRAIHIELVPSLTADSCILAVRNFTNLRGTPEKFHSDNGTNFKGADKELQEEFKKLDKEKIQTHFTKTYTSWDFNPPAAPHFGGSWERLVASVKTNLKRVMFTRAPKEELLRSYLWEVVNIINSRPLTYVPIDDREDEVLTPNHFIFGTSNGHLAPGDFPFEEKSLLKAWRRSQELTNMFWRRWVKEYLPTLTCRTKWFPKAKPIETGDVVLLVDERNARNSYPRGVVLETLPDKRGQVRQAKIRTSEVIPDIFGRKTIDAPVRYSIKTRPVAKLAVLDVVNERDKGKSKELDVDSKQEVKVKTIGTRSIKGLNGEENVNDTKSKTAAKVNFEQSGRLSTLRPRNKRD